MAAREKWCCWALHKWNLESSCDGSNSSDVWNRSYNCVMHHTPSFSSSNLCWAVSKKLSFSCFNSSKISSSCHNTASRFLTSSCWLFQLCTIFIVLSYICSRIFGGVHCHAEYIASGIQGTLSATMGTMAWIPVLIALVLVSYSLIILKLRDRETRYRIYPFWWWWRMC